MLKIIKFKIVNKLKNLFIKEILKITINNTIYILINLLKNIYNLKSKSFNKQIYKFMKGNKYTNKYLEIISLLQ